MHCTTHCTSHYDAHTNTYIAAHHTGTHQPTSAFATDTSHSAAYTYTGEVLRWHLAEVNHSVARYERE